MNFHVESPVFRNGAFIPTRYAHPPVGEDVSPPLQWDELPAGTRSLAIICEDPDAPQEEPFVHWVLYGIPADRQELVENEGRQYSEGRNDFGENGWGGPLPPPGHGVHHYHFTVYALDITLDAEAGLTRSQLLERIEGHVLAQAATVGCFERAGEEATQQAET